MSCLRFLGRESPSKANTEELIYILTLAWLEHAISLLERCKIVNVTDIVAGVFDNFDTVRSWNVGVTFQP